MAWRVVPFRASGSVFSEALGRQLPRGRCGRCGRRPEPRAEPGAPNPQPGAPSWPCSPVASVGRLAAPFPKEPVSGGPVSAGLPPPPPFPFVSDQQPNPDPDRFWCLCRIWIIFLTDAFGFFSGTVYSWMEYLGAAVGSEWNSVGNSLNVLLSAGFPPKTGFVSVGRLLIVHSPATC